MADPNVTRPFPPPFPELGGGEKLPSRAELIAQMAQLPPAETFRGEIAFAVANADIIRDDYAAALGEVSDATSYGRRQKFVHYGLGAVCGVALGVLVGKFVL